MEWLPKDPDDTRRYSVDWSEIYPDAIVTSDFTVSSGTVTLSDEDFDPRLAFVLVAGGADDETATILNEITTLDGQTLSKSITLRIGEGVDVLSPVSTLTKGDLGIRALGKLGIANYVFDMEAEESVSLLRQMDTMAAAWASKLNDFGYRQPATSGASLPSDTAGIDEADVDTFVSNLALIIAPDYGKTPSPILIRQAMDSRSDLFIKYRRTQEVVMSRRTPVGAGNRWFGRRFYTGR